MTDQSLMPFGKYKGKTLEDVPAKYLCWLYDNATVGKDLRKYLEDNLDVLRKQAREEDEADERDKKFQR